MNLLPLAGFYWKHGSQIEAMLGKGPPSLLLDIASALEPVIKKHFPNLNANGLLDDALATLKQMEAIYTPPESLGSI